MGLSITLSRNHSWAIAYINRDFIYRVEKDLKKYDRYKTVKVYIPMVRILRKQFKGRDIFEEVPFLFNYGFFQIPNKNLSADFLSQMKDDIECIQAWVKDSKTVINTKTSLITGNEPIIRKDIIPVATATRGEIYNIINAHKKMSIYDKFDINNLKSGMVIDLKGYPFDGMTAKVIRVDKKREKVDIELVNVDSLIKKTSVTFDNIFYSIYHGYDENNMREKRIEDIKARSINKQKYDYDK